MIILQEFAAQEVKDLELICAETIQNVTNTLSECQQELANDEDYLVKIADHKSTLAACDRNKVRRYSKHFLIYFD